MLCHAFNSVGRTAASVGVLIAALSLGCSRDSQQPNALGPELHVTRTDEQINVVSTVHHIDKIYPSMSGPWSETKITLLDEPQAELVWITGAEVRMLDATGQKRMPNEFMCHANLDLNSTTHCELMGLSKPLDGRLFTLSQGQLLVKFPKGTGIPVRSDLPLTLITQVLNLNIADADFKVRHHVTIDFVRDRDLKGPMQPLYESGVSSQVCLEGHPLAYDVMDHGTGSQLSGMCIPGEKAMDWDEQEDRYGRRFTGHWLVPPGKQRNVTRCTSIMNVPHDTRLFAIAVHLHPYAESLELRDVTEQKTIFKSEAVNFRDRVGLEHIASFASKEGVPVYKNHEYEMISTYNNTSRKNVDSMAVMYLYLGDTEFDRAEVLRRIAANPRIPATSAAASSASSGPRM